MTAPVGTFHAPQQLDQLKGGLARPARLERALQPVSALTLVSRFALGGVGYVAWLGFSMAIVPFPYSIFVDVYPLGVGLLTWVRVFRRFNIEYAAACERLQSGDFDGAASVLERLAKSRRGTPQASALANTQLGQVELRRGDLGRALSAFAAAVDAPFLRYTQPIVAETGRYHVAMTYALLGDLEAAEGWLAKADQHRTLRHTHTGELAHAIIAARRRRYADVLARIDEKRRILEAAEPTASMRILLTVRAFALSQMPEAAPELTAAVDAARSPFPGEVRWLGTAWPEMQAFLTEWKL